jgi:hypothetical protein
MELRIGARGTPRKACAAQNERVAASCFLDDGTTGKEAVDDSDWCVQISKNLCQFPESLPSPN